MAGSIAGELIRGDMKPKVPKWFNVDTTTEQGAAIAGNLLNFDDAAKLGAKTQEELLRQLMTSLEKLMPGYGALNQQIMGNIASEARGEVPVDVQNFIQRQAAERGITTGTSGSDFDKYRATRNLGLASLELTDRAIESASRWMATTTSRLPTSDFTQMFITPQQRIATTFQNRVMKFNRDWMENQIDAQPDAWQRALANLFDNIEEIGQSALGSWAGGAMGGGGGTAGGGGGGAGMYGGGSSWG